MIIGIDHGYYAIKTKQVCFPTGIIRYEYEPYTMQNVLQYRGEYYVCGTGRQTLVKDKTANDNYYLLTLAALAQEIRKRKGERTAKVVLAAGLPLTGFGREKQKFKEYLFRKEQPIRFLYEGERYEIQIEDVKLFPQGYSALALYPEYLKDEPSVLLVDIGGWTVDLMRLDNAVPNAERLAGKIKDAVTGEDTDTGVFHDFVYEESGVEGAAFELYAKDTIYSPDGAKDEQGNPVIRYEKDDLVATLVTDTEGKAVVNNLPLGSYYMKETIAGDHFVLNPEQKEFTLTAEDDTQAVVYEGVAYKNERQKISISVEKKDAVTEEKLEGVIFGLYAKEDILSQQGEVLVEKDTLLEKKATDEKGQLTFDSDLYHGKYYVKEEVRKPGYLPNEEIWEIDASYIDQNLAEIKLTKEVENQPTKSQFTKTDATTGEELEGAKLQIIDQDGNIVEEWISTKEPHVVYGLPEGTYTLHEELPPYAEGYVSAEDMEFEVKEDGSVTKVEMKDTYSKVEISKTDLTTGKELEGAKLQILNKEGEVLEEWVTDGKPHLVEKLPVGEELILREITAPEGYEIAEDVKFTLEDTMEVQKVEMKDARTPETPGVPQTGDDHWKQILLFALLGVSAAGLMATMLYKKRHKKADEAKKEE